MGISITKFGSNTPLSRPFIEVGHRGAVTDKDPKNVRPENTIPALQKAYRQGVAIELDVMTTRDNKVILHHDYKTGRIFKLPGQQKDVKDTDWKELKTATLNEDGHAATLSKQYGGTPFGKPGNPYPLSTRYKTVQIPELETAVKELPADARIFVELKSPSLLRHGPLESKVVKLIQENNLYDRVKVISFSPVSLRMVKSMDPKIKTGLNFELPKWMPKNKLFLKAYVNGYAKRLLGVDFVQPCYKQASKALIDVAHKANLPVIAWVYQETRAEEAKTFPELMDRGIDGIITNSVDLLQEAVSNRQGGSLPKTGKVAAQP